MEWEKLTVLLRQYGLLITLGLVGAILLVYGVWQAVVPEKAMVEIVRDSQSSAEGVVYIDVAGAVERPGVYQLPSEARIGDALVAAGGLSARADREWVAQTVNLAQRIEDGQKVYIPVNEEGDGPVERREETAESRQNKKISVNTATQAELETLSGIGEVRAKEIIDNRPYSAIDELVSKAKVPQSVYDKIKDMVSLY